MTTSHCTDPTANTPRTPRANHRRRDRRGSAIILVIVSIVLMAVLGATFVQVARFERISTGGEHIDIAIDSILNEVAVELGKDLYDDNGNFFNPAGSVGDATDPGGGDEPYDFPWTNDTIPGQRPVTFVDGTGGVAEGGANDDPWLANTLVDSAGIWGHVSDLTGRRLAVTNRDLTLVGQANPGEAASTAAFFENINVSDVRLVDADGDGIGDSLWAYAPTAEIAGKRYVYAIRIVDLSARVNVNTALGVSNGAGNPTAAPRGDSPVEIDATRVAFEYGDDAGWTQSNGVADYYQTIGHRLASHPAGLVAWGDASNERRHFWLFGAAQVTAGLINTGTDTNYLPVDTYGQGDLFELLYRGGLNNSGVTTQVEVNMPRLLRAANTEFIYTDTPAAMNSNAYDFMRNNARRHFTTASGVIGISPPTSPPVAAGTAPTLRGPDHNADGTGERILQVDINHSSLAELTTVIAETLAANGTFDATNFGHFGSPAADPVQFASQLAVNIVDMRDPDNQLTSHNGQFGMEALPFLAEVYVQREYSPVPAGAVGPDVAGEFDVTYNAVSQSDYAIEIRNPFQVPIDLTSVHLLVGGASWGDLATVTGSAPAELLPGEVLLIYSNQSAAPEDVSSGVTADHAVDLSADAARQWPNPAGPGTAAPVVVELQAEAQGAAGVPIGWAYSRVNASAPPASYVENGAATPTPIELRPFLQISDQGTGTGLNILQVSPADIAAAQSTTEPSQMRSTIHALGTASKAGDPPAANDWDTGDQQWLFLDKATSATDTDGRIPYVADILTIPVVGPNDLNAPNATLAAAIQQSAATRLDHFMLEYRLGVAPPAQVVNASAPSLNVPHALLLLERLTTHSPSVDGEDLDGDGVDTAPGGTPDYDEAFVPGKININTASRELLIAALPYPTLAQRTAVANRIIDFRENSTNFATAPARPATARSSTLPGIAYTGELYEQLTTDLAAAGGAQPDWNDHQTGGMTSGNTFLLDNVTGDREEELMLSKWLNEVCATRSDVFAVYMVVQGYPAGNFGAGAVESARVVAVFSRANVRQVGDKAQLIAVRRVE